MGAGRTVSNHFWQILYHKPSELFYICALFHGLMFFAVNNSMSAILLILFSAVSAVAAGVIATVLARRRESERKDVVRSRMREILELSEEMDTPVSLIKAPLSDLERNETLSENGRDALETARKNVDKLLLLIRKIKDTGTMGLSTHSQSEADPDRVRSFPSTVPSSAGKTSEASLLIAGKVPEMVEYLSRSLSTDYAVSTAMGPEETWACVDGHGPDLLMIVSSDTDNGALELCKRIKSTVTTSHIPVILISSRDDREHIVSGLEVGVDDYIVKPFDMSVLRSRVKNILEERERLRNSFQRQGRKSEKIDYANRLDQEFMEHLMQIMEEELDNSEFSVNDLCREVGMSRTALYNKLKSLTGQGPNDFVRNFRLSKARELLEGRLYSISEVSDMVGFSDPKYFSVCFKKAFGVSPSKV